MKDWVSDWAIPGFLIFIAVGIVAVIGAVCYTAIVHPCIKYGEPKQCTRFETFCYSRYVCETTPVQYDCTQCLERKP